VTAFAAKNMKIICLALSGFGSGLYWAGLTSFHPWHGLLLCFGGCGRVYQTCPSSRCPGSLANEAVIGAAAVHLLRFLCFGHQFEDPVADFFSKDGMNGTMRRVAVGV
jgi:hypothetical protein